MNLGAPSRLDNPNAALSLYHLLDPAVLANPYPLFDLHDYFTKYLDYRLNDEKRQGLKKFLHYLKVPETEDLHLL